MKSIPAQALGFLRNPIILPIYLPTFFFGVALGMIKPVLPLYVADFDVSYALIGLVVGAEALGAMFADVPAGVLLRRFTERQVMLSGQTMVMLGMLLLFLAPSVWMAFVSLLMFGTGRALFNVSRHMFLSEMFAPEQRGRAIAVFGGMVRMGYAIGPIVGGLVAARLGLRAPFLLVCAIAVFGIVLVALLLKETRRRDRSRSREEGLAVVETLRDNRPMLARAGSGVLFGQAIRARAQRHCSSLRGGRTGAWPGSHRRHRQCVLGAGHADVSACRLGDGQTGAQARHRSQLPDHGDRNCAHSPDARL